MPASEASGLGVTNAVPSASEQIDQQIAITWRVLEGADGSGPPPSEGDPWQMKVNDKNHWAPYGAVAYD